MLVCIFILTGCAAKTEVYDEPEIELLEPVSQGASTEKAAVRTLYKTTSYSAAVYPKTAEYSFTESLNVVAFPYMPGDSVKAGDVICYGDTKDIDKNISNAEEALNRLTEEYEEYKLTAGNTLSELKSKLSGLSAGSTQYKLT